MTPFWSKEDFLGFLIGMTIMVLYFLGFLWWLDAIAIR